MGLTYSEKNNILNFVNIIQKLVNYFFENTL